MRRYRHQPRHAGAGSRALQPGHPQPGRTDRSHGTGQRCPQADRAGQVYPAAVRPADSQGQDHRDRCSRRAAGPVPCQPAANDLFDISRKKQLLGKAVGEIMDDYPIINMIAFNREIVQDCIYLNEQKRYIERVLTNDRKNKLILCIMKDVTREKESEKKQNRAKAEAVQMADKLAAEQLRIVHEIASLLGETAADTKVAIEELKQTILQEIK